MGGEQIDETAARVIEQKVEGFVEARVLRDNLGDDPTVTKC